MTTARPKPFRLFLQEELIRRCEKNRGYSLRAFARTLAINPASLSRMLRGERDISVEMKQRLGMRLGLGPVELQKFSADGDGTTPAYSQLSLDAFAVISDWFHFAILELTKLP